ncbi:MAG: hypothetical protein Ct9H300mP19_15700 [Dehalococcoidia bacterium]|nr:MAG: hypothetical protein Ct9H300mP19_15700 [Dehalococcoidia bacterium]
MELFFFGIRVTWLFLKYVVVKFLIFCWLMMCTLQPVYTVEEQAVNLSDSSYSASSRGYFC